VTNINMVRVVHGTSRLGLYLTCNRPVQDQVGGFPTRNRPVIIMGLLVRVSVR